MDRVLSGTEMTKMMRDLLVSLRSFTNIHGVMMVEPTLRYGSFGETATTFCSHDYSDPTTWYQRSIRYSEELVSEDNFVYKLTHAPVINANSYKLYGRDFAMPMPDSSLTDRSVFLIEVKIDEAIILQDDVEYKWTIDYKTGEITFKERVPNEKKVSVNYSAISLDDPARSRYVLKPEAGKMIVVEHLELQFSKSTQINDEIVFELWAGPPEASALFGNPTYRNSPMNPWRQSYRCAQDFINNGNEGQGEIPPFGGDERGLKTSTIVFPFKYIQAFPIESKYNSELHIYLKNNIPYTETEIVTCALYTSIQKQRT